ncbi:MAG: hypothetical protein GTN64_08700 [Candidatus Latescibacteria bacterium]|nr:hypothetical protein [Candidatus Latescibacterota bacterium]NIO78678.1 hypothetical protein [Candidatus Latescibacterota bacterium]
MPDSDAPATIMDTLEEIIAADDAEEAAKAQEAIQINASEKALLYAKDHGVPIEKVTGTGVDGKIIVPDVQKYKKESDAKAKAEAEAKAKEKAEPPAKVEEKPKKPRRKPKTKAVSSFPLLPTLRANLKEIYHIVRSIHEFGMGWENSVVSGAEADENIGKMLEEGWVILHIQTLGVDMDGIRMLWVMGVPDESIEDKVWPYREILHLTRPIGNIGDDGRGITGLQANEFISGYLRDGWDLAMVEALGMGTGIINMMWVLVR